MTHPISNSSADSSEIFKKESGVVKETTIRRIYYWWLIPLVIHSLTDSYKRFIMTSEDILLVVHLISNLFADSLEILKNERALCTRT